MSGPDEQTRALRAARAGVHLVFILLVGVSALRAWDRGLDLRLALAAGVALTGVYLAGRWAAAGGPRAASLWFVLLGGVWLAALWASPEFVWVSFPLLLVGGHLFGGVRGVLVGVGIVAVAIGVPWLTRGSVTLAEVLGPVIGGAVAVGMARGYTSVLADAAEHRRLNASLLAAQREAEDLQAALARAQRAEGALAERTRLARDIHDTIAQEFASIALLARAGESRAGAARDPAVLGADDDPALDRIASIARRGAEDARRIVAALLPAELESTELPDALARVVAGFSEESGIAATWQAEPTRPIGTAAEVALLRTLQTALANVRAHAHATRVGVELREIGAMVRLDIVDDGIGFDVASWGSGRAPRSGAQSVGLREARERLRECGGGLDIEGAPGDGTALSAWLPAGNDETGQRGGSDPW